MFSLTESSTDPTLSTSGRGYSNCSISLPPPQKYVDFMVDVTLDGSELDDSFDCPQEVVASRDAYDYPQDVASRDSYDYPQEVASRDAKQEARSCSRQPRRRYCWCGCMPLCMVAGWITVVALAIQLFLVNQEYHKLQNAILFNIDTSNNDNVDGAQDWGKKF
jgi:hypothetical protein